MSLNLMGNNQEKFTRITRIRTFSEGVFLGREGVTNSRSKASQPTKVLEFAIIIVFLLHF